MSKTNFNLAWEIMQLQDVGDRLDDHRTAARAVLLPIVRSHLREAVAPSVIDFERAIARASKEIEAAKHALNQVYDATRAGTTN